MPVRAHPLVWLGLSALLLGGCAAPPAPSWEERALLEGPPGGTDALDCLVAAPGGMYAAGNRGQPDLEPQRARPFLLVSEDGGATWRSLQVGLGEVAVTCLAVDDARRVLLAGSHEGLYRSVDGGRRWERLVRGLPDRLEVAAVALDPGAPDVMLAASTGGALFTSQDRGRSWSEGQGATGLPAALLASATGRGLLHTDAGLFASVDQGRSWQRLASHVGLPGRGALSVAPSPAGAAAVACAVVWEDGEGRVIRSRDGGASWSELPGSAGALDVELDPGAPDTIYLLRSRGEDALLVSRDGGGSWEPLGGRVNAAGLVVSRDLPRTVVAYHPQSLRLWTLRPADPAR